MAVDLEYSDMVNSLVVSRSSDSGDASVDEIDGFCCFAISVLDSHLPVT
jgi:hypothetical protein